MSLSVVGLVVGLVVAILLELLLSMCILSADVLGMASEAAEHAGTTGNGKSASNSCRFFLVTSPLVIFAHKHILNSRLVQIVL